METAEQSREPRAGDKRAARPRPWRTTLMTIMESRPTAAEAAPEMQLLLAALVQLRKGDPNVRLPLHWSGVSGRVADAFNEVVELNARMAEELSRLRQMVGKEGKLKQRASLRDARGFWSESIDCINALIDDLVH